LSERATLLQFSRQRVPDPRPCSGKAPVTIRVVCTSNDTRQWIGWPETAWSGDFWLIHTLKFSSASQFVYVQRASGSPLGSANKPVARNLLQGVYHWRTIYMLAPICWRPFSVIITSDITEHHSLNLNTLLTAACETKTQKILCLLFSGSAAPGRARTNDLAGRSTALAQALAPPCLALRIALLRSQCEQKLSPLLRWRCHCCFSGG